LVSSVDWCKEDRKEVQDVLDDSGLPSRPQRSEYVSFSKT
jgi:hypothetical protein